MPKAPAPTDSRKRRHNPLEDDLLATGPLRSKPHKRVRSDEAKPDDGEHFVDSRASRQILKMSHVLAHEEQEEKTQAPAKPPIDSFALESRLGRDHDNAQERPLEDEEDVWGSDGEVEKDEIDPQDLVTWRMFFPEDDDPLLKQGWPGSGEANEESEQPRNMADIIMQKIKEAEARASQDAKGEEEPEEPELAPEIVALFTKVGLFLSRYRSGAMVKAIKILPQLPNWVELMMITKPESWSPAATSAVTKIFVAAKSDVVQDFLELVVLPKVREDIDEHKKLNPHYFSALQKALFKPAAWFKGFLFPLMDSGTCTLREAAIAAGVLKRHRVPMLHAAAGLKSLCDIATEHASQGTEGGGATNILIYAILSKGYALPYQVIDDLVLHFLRFRSVDPASVQGGDFNDKFSTIMTDAAPARTKLPVIWHKCLLVFAQKYKNDLSEDAREALLDLLLTHGHKAIGPEIRKELLAGRNREEAPPEPEVPFDGDDTMMGGW